MIYYLLYHFLHFLGYPMLAIYFRAGLIILWEYLFLPIRYKSRVKSPHYNIQVDEINPILTCSNFWQYFGLSFTKPNQKAKITVQIIHQSTLKCLIPGNNCVSNLILQSRFYCTILYLHSSTINTFSQSLVFQLIL